MRRRDALQFACPTCGVGKDERCIAKNSNNARISQSHVARIRLLKDNR